MLQQVIGRIVGGAGDFYLGLFKEVPSVHVSQVDDRQFSGDILRQDNR